MALVQDPHRLSLREEHSKEKLEILDRLLLLADANVHVHIYIVLAGEIVERYLERLVQETDDLILPDVLLVHLD